MGESAAKRNKSAMELSRLKIMGRQYREEALGKLNRVRAVKKHHRTAYSRKQRQAVLVKTVPGGNGYPTWAGIPAACWRPGSRGRRCPGRLPS